MTAEQFYEVWRSTKYATPKQAWPHANHAEVCEFADANATAQLAEKEREIARSQQFAAQLESNIKFLNERVAAAEQRLQEAQGHLGRKNVEIERLQDGWTKAVADKHLLIAQLRQREAELDEIREHCVSEHECTFCQLPTRIETMNDQLIATSGDTIVVMLPKSRMTTEEALRQAAWLVAITGETERFKEVLAAVLNT